jgi:hypothetical protein
MNMCQDYWPVIANNGTKRMVHNRILGPRRMVLRLNCSTPAMEPPTRELASIPGSVGMILGRRRHPSTLPNARLARMETLGRRPVNLRAPFSAGLYPAEPNGRIPKDFFASAPYTSVASPDRPHGPVPQAEIGQGCRSPDRLGPFAKPLRAHFAGQRSPRKFARILRAPASLSFV